MRAANPPEAVPPGTGAAVDTARLAPGQQLLVYEPDGPLGGTFTCTACGVQAWQPDLLQHLLACRYRPRG